MIYSMKPEDLEEEEAAPASDFKFDLPVNNNSNVDLDSDMMTDVQKPNVIKMQFKS